jgi:predicted RND superfamily exporter protein
VTTTGALGTLAVAILPVFAQFGRITAIAVVYAFLASVLVLPALLVLWTKYATTGVSLQPPGEAGGGDGGGESDA